MRYLDLTVVVKLLQNQSSKILIAGLRRRLTQTKSTKLYNVSKTSLIKCFFFAGNRDAKACVHLRYRNLRHLVCYLRDFKPH